MYKNQTATVPLISNEIRTIIRVQACVKRWIARKNYLKTRRLLLRLQAVVRTMIVGRKLLRKARKYAKRMRVAQEIVDVEECYVNDLRNCLEVFLAPMAKKGIVLPPDIVDIFGGLEIIYEIHKFILVRLQQNMEVFDVKNGGFGCIFLIEISNFVVYEKYINIYNRVLDSISLFRQHNIAFKAHLVANECTPKTRGLDLDSILIQPVQRLPRYVMLLQEYLKHTSPKNHDYVEAELAVKKLKQMINLMNESKRKSLNEDARKKIVHSVSGADLLAFNAESDFVMEGQLMLSHRIFSDERVYFYVFKDMILFAKAEEGTLEGTLRKSISKIFHSKLYTLKLKHTIRSKEILQIESESGDCSFVLVTKDTIYNLVAPNPKKKNDWVNQLKKLITNKPVLPST